MIIRRFVCREDGFELPVRLVGDRGVFEVVFEFDTVVGGFAVVFVVGFFGAEGVHHSEVLFEFGVQFPELHHGVVGPAADDAAVLPCENEVFVKSVMKGLGTGWVSQPCGQGLPD